MGSSSNKLPRRRRGANDKGAIPVSLRRRKKSVRPSILPRLLVGCLSSIVLIIVVGITIAFGVYTSLTAELIPRLESIKNRTSFETSRLYDRNGKVLYEFFGTGRRTKVTLPNISKFLIAGTISIEDKTFFTNPGVDWVGIARAAVRSVTAGTVVGGGSTISQQVIKQVVLTEQERAFDIQSRVRRKVLELVLAQELSRQYSKSQILELYLNEIYYGNLAYGIEAAANTYFKTTAAKLDLSQASLLAGMPQLPSVYDPYLYTKDNVIPGITLNDGWLNAKYQLGDDVSPTKWRQIAVLRQMVENDDVTEADAKAAAAKDLVFAGQEVPINAPHFVFYVRNLLEKEYGPQFATLGYSIYTTIDLELQQKAQQFATERIASLEERNIHNAAVVVMQPNTGQILSMVGSVDYNKTVATTSENFEGNVLDGQVNVTTNLRQPGSALKPFTYISAMEQGMTPATILWDVKTTFPLMGEERYSPTNYNGKWNGPLRMRQAVANSLNMPAIMALKYAGISNTINLLQRAGITSLKRGEGFYGLALTLGGGEVTPLDLTTAYNTLASNGRYFPPIAVLKVVDNNGRIIAQYKKPEAQPVINPELVAIMQDMMSDDKAREGIWGTDSKLKLSRTAAVKTGTSNDWRDAWALGYTPYVTVGVWTGNNNNEPTQRVESLTGGGIIWRNIMEYMFADERLNTLLAQPFDGQMPLEFTRPKGVRELPICPLPGAFNNRTTELFTRTMSPSPLAPPPGMGDDPTSRPAPALTDDPCAGLLQPITVVKLTETIPESGVITDSVVLSQTLCLPSDTTFAPDERKLSGFAWLLPVPEPEINALYQWEVPKNVAEFPMKFIPADARSIAVCTPEMLSQFGPPVEGAVRMPEIRGLDAQVASDTLVALGVPQTLIYVDLQTRDRIPDAFDQYQPNQVIGSIPAPGDWILPGTSVTIGARAP